MARLYPMYADLAGRPVVVIGGGPVAERKVEGLLACGAVVSLISPKLTEKLSAWHQAGRIAVQQRPFAPGDTRGAWLVIAACGDAGVNRRVFDEASQEGIFCNVVDEPDLCSFQVPAVVRRGELQIAVSTGGASPALAKRLRRQIEERLGPEYEIFLADLARIRQRLRERFPLDQKKRAARLEALVRSEALDLLRTGDIPAYRRLLDQWRHD